MVHVTYDPKLLDYQRLLKNAKQMECTSTVFTYGDEQWKAAKAAGIEKVAVWKDDLATRKVAKKEQKYYLRGTLYGYLPLTESQAVKANSMLINKMTANVETILSPRQIKLRGRIQKALSKDRDSLKGLGLPLYGEIVPAKQESTLIEYEKALRSKLDELEN